MSFTCEYDHTVPVPHERLVSITVPVPYDWFLSLTVPVPCDWLMNTPACNRLFVSLFLAHIIVPLFLVRLTDLFTSLLLFRVIDCSLWLIVIINGSVPRDSIVSITVSSGYHTPCSLWLSSVYHSSCSMWLSSGYHSSCSIWLNSRYHCSCSIWLSSGYHCSSSMWLSSGYHCSCFMWWVVAMPLFVTR